MERATGSKKKDERDTLMVNLLELVPLVPPKVKLGGSMLDNHARGTSG